MAATDRLYVQFHQQEGWTTYHWSLLWAPAHENVTTECFAFDVTNNHYFQDGVYHPNPSKQWVHRPARVVYPMASQHLIARILIAELPPDSMGRVGEIASSVPILQDDAGFNGATWVIAALEQLRVLYSDIPTPNARFKELALAHAEASKALKHTISVSLTQITIKYIL